MDKIITFDLDGTLINEKNEIIGGEETINLLRKFQVNGYELVMNTGRLDHDIVYIQNKYNLPVSIRISQNGAVIVKENNVTATLLDKASALGFYQDIKNIDVRVEINTVTSRYWHKNRDENFPKEFYDSSHIVKDFTPIINYQPIVLFLLIGNQKSIEGAQDIIESKYPKLKAVKTSSTSLEILNPRVSKGNAIHNHFPNTEIYAIGDSENDYSLFEHATKAYLIGNQTHKHAKQVNTILEALKDIKV